MLQRLQQHKTQDMATDTLHAWQGPYIRIGIVALGVTQAINNKKHMVHASYAYNHTTMSMSSLLT
jgi:hypothetical protein